ncbi:hypothetical protein QN277_022323 [Acacia crassicarpa]|uniref:PGG domain-containing protein n=1 Tax=Acacia crassicarpa TaxID=499986 RepID=A0AAE1MQI9_9FABA|nr:hypothetical protein QN277_022323 [Acacia crassicarpa]
MNIETAHDHEVDKMRVLYDASYKGCVSTLNSLLQEDPGLLYKISSQTILIETPLHISASHGHLDFTKTLLSHKPELALERNYSQSTPLHLASAEGHVDIVKQLLEAREVACMVGDQEGRIPLHYAVIRGRKDVVLELIRAKAESSKILDHLGKTIFHLCVTYNQLEILKELVNKLDTHGTHELLIKGDLDGKNTILHLAIMLKQVETVMYLLSIPKAKELVRLKNDMDLTAYDILKRSPRDFKTLEIQVMLMEYSGIRTENNRISQIRRKKKRNCLIGILKWIGGWFRHKGDWLEEMRGNLSLVSTVIASITFQSLINPPGGPIQQGLSGLSNAPLNCTTLYDNESYCPGEAVSSFRFQGSAFSEYVICNTISFMSSLSVTLLLFSGVSMKNKALIWLLSIGMCVTLTTLALAYVCALAMVMPRHLQQNNAVSMTIESAIFAWCGLLGLIMVLITLRLIIWSVKKFVRAIRKFVHRWN